MLVTWSGRGWLGMLVVVPALLAGAAIGRVVPEPWQAPLQILAFALVGVLLCALLGRVNRQDGEWTDAHRLGPLPLQLAGAYYVGLAVFGLAIHLGQSYAGWLGWVTFIVLELVTVGVAAALSDRVTPAGMWRYEAPVRARRPATPPRTSGKRAPRWRPTETRPEAGEPSSTVAPAGPVTLTADRVELTADRDGLRVRVRAAGTSSSLSEVELAWAQLQRLYFDTDRQDPKVALYATTTSGRRRHLLDADRLTDADWRSLAASITGLTGGRLTLDVSARRRHDA